MWEEADGIGEIKCWGGCSNGSVKLKLFDEIVVNIIIRGSSLLFI